MLTFSCRFAESVSVSSRIYRSLGFICRTKFSEGEWTLTISARKGFAGEIPTPSVLGSRQSYSVEEYTCLSELS